ncbi:DUF1801 domain-containing protein [Paenibacillus psychroresistens]|uniref:DUF1801 domain-containing protein n=1 Tax=Paenibacillus psychroresistens TaxID=1778678 RepID=A0A6B8RV79_9BACL|nr:DUF1801 domain-containing protein [Paenibacillus psychroresistens]QGR00352.1 DUF1801 domain-containing protein [Paenibacillus psychroresistens]
MNEEVTIYIEKLGAAWQIELSMRLREMVHETITSVEERIQYKKPHFLKNGHYAAVISPSKDAIAFMIMNTVGLEFPKGFEGPPERKWIKIKEGVSPDYTLLSSLLAQASQAL